MPLRVRAGHGLLATCPSVGYGPQLLTQGVQSGSLRLPLAVGVGQMQHLQIHHLGTQLHAEATGEDPWPVAGCRASRSAATRRIARSASPPRSSASTHISSVVASPSRIGTAVPAGGPSMPPVGSAEPYRHGPRACRRRTSACPVRPRREAAPRAVPASRSPRWLGGLPSSRCRRADSSGSACWCRRQ